MTNTTILAIVRYFACCYILRGKYSDMARTWIGFKPTSKSKTYVFVELFTSNLYYAITMGSNY